MSLYDAAPDDSNIKAIAAIGERPIWLTIALALAVIYALAASTQVVVYIAAHMESFMETFKADPTGIFVAIVVHGLLVVVSAIYFFMPITALGLAAATIWLASLLAVCLRIFEINVPVIDNFYILPNLGIGDVGNIGAVVQMVVPIVIFLFSSIKYRPA